MEQMDIAVSWRGFLRYHQRRSVALTKEAMSTSDQDQLVLKTDMLCESSKKAAATSQSLEEDVDLCKQFGSDTESLWLSCDCSSPSAFFREYRWSDSFHSHELLLPSWLSLLAGTNPMEEASSLLIDRRDEDKNLQEWSEDENARGFFVCSSEGAESCGGNFSEDSPSCGNSSTPLDFEGIGCRFSLLNLDGDDYKLTPSTDSRSDCFLSDFPSPSYKSSSWGHEFQLSNSSVSTPSEAQTELSSRCDFSSQHASEAENLEDLNTTDEPLFWPFERKTDWNSEATWTYFSMSPRKGISITASGTPSDSIPLKHHDMNMDVEERQGRRIVFSSGSAASKIMELKQKYSKGVRQTNTLPSRLSRATKRSEKIVPLDTKDDAVEPEKRKVHVSEPVGVVNDRIEEDFASKEVPIEMFLGLAEFDGHEGVDSGFNEDDFSLHVSLC